MRTSLLSVILLFASYSMAQDSFYPSDSALLNRDGTETPTVIVIAGTSKGKCTPEMPMLKPKTSYEIQLQATATKTFLLDSNDFKMHLTAAPGKTVSQVITPDKDGNFNFICGDQALPEKQRTQGMFMVMEM